MSTILFRYLDAEALNRLAGRSIEPEGLVLGNLAGGHRSPLAGFAVEFSGHREYIPGDDPRHIDWRLLHRRDKLFVKQYEMETNFACFLVLDVSASMRYGEGASNKLAFASRLATTLGYLVIKQNDKVALATVDELVRGFVPPGQTITQIYRMIEEIESIDPTADTRLPECLLELAGRTGRRAIVMIFSDLLGEPDALEPALQQLRFRDHEVVLFQTLHPDERAFDLEGPIRFVGLEEPFEERADAEDIRDAYLAAQSAHAESLQTICRRNRVEFVPVDTGRQLAESLASYLDERR